MKFNSIKFEISILYTAILGLILIVFSGVLYLISHAFLQQVDQQLKVKAQAVDLTLRSYMNVLGPTHEALNQAVAKTMAMKNENFLQYKTWRISQKWSKEVQSLNLNKDYVNFVEKNTKEVLGSSSMVNERLRVLFMEDLQFPPLAQVTFRTLSLRDKNIRVINYPFRDEVLGEYLIQVGVLQDSIMEQLRNWLYSIAISVPIILILTNFVGRVLANRILKPVYEITDLAKHITQQDLSIRIKGKQFDREMGSLVDSFNEMIDRLEHSFKHIEQFSYHAAHELKTPLTIIQGEANLLLRKDRSVSEYKQALQIIQEESQRVLRTIDDLLLLTKLGYQNEVFKFGRFDFMEMFNEIVEQNRFLAADKGIGIRTDFQSITSPLMINGDRLHLRRLFFNVIDNAIKFSPTGGCIDMRVEKEQDKVVTSISDMGPGIHPENLAKIFDTFYRADKRGSGVGLSIAYTIAKMHHGDIRVHSQVGHGATFQMVLPLMN